MHTPTGAGGVVIPRQNTEEEQTYIVPRAGGQGQNVFAAAAPIGVRIETQEEATYIGNR